MRQLGHNIVKAPVLCLACLHTIRFKQSMPGHVLRGIFSFLFTQTWHANTINPKIINDASRLEFISASYGFFFDAYLTCTHYSPTGDNDRR